ncbi:MAG: hypothetical protein QW343_00780 [Candidatus Norongarragalinales archaeon]
MKFLEQVSFVAEGVGKSKGGLKKFFEKKLRFHEAVWKKEVEAKAKKACLLE